MADNVTYHAFVWTEVGGMQDLGTLGRPDSSAIAINKFGEVVGWSYLSNNLTVVHAFLWTQAGGMKDLGTLGGDTGVAFAVSPTGQVFGEATTLAKKQQAFIWTSSRGMQSLGAGETASRWELTPRIKW